MSTNHLSFVSPVRLFRRVGTSRLSRATFLGFVAVGLLVAPTRIAEAQPPAGKRPGWELIVPAGTVVATGVQRHQVKQGKLTAVQVSHEVRRHLAVTATVGWARTRDISVANDPKLDVFMYDLGAEVRASRPSGGGVTVRPFASAGAGARSYNYRSLPVDATHNAAAYVGIGSELGVSRVRVRLEARGYATGFKPLDGSGASHTRNDVVFMAGVRLVKR